MYSRVEPVSHASQPIVTGTSVVGIKTKDSVVMAADMLFSYGSLARFKAKRLHKLNDNVLLGISGDAADMDYLLKMLHDVIESDSLAQDNLYANQIHQLLRSILYGRRSKVDPLWNSIVVGGYDDKKELFIGYVDLYGTTNTSPHQATGFGMHLAVPLLRTTKGDTRAAMEEIMKVLYYRDARSSNIVQIAVIKDHKITIEELTLETNWDVANYVQGY